MFGDNVKPLVQLIPVYLNKMPWLKERFASQTAEPVNQFKSRWQRLWGQLVLFLSNSQWYRKLWMDTQFKAPKFILQKFCWVVLNKYIQIKIDNFPLLDLAQFHTSNSNFPNWWVGFMQGFRQSVSRNNKFIICHCICFSFRLHCHCTFFKKFNVNLFAFNFKSLFPDGMWPRKNCQNSWISTENPIPMKDVWATSSFFLNVTYPDSDRHQGKTRVKVTWWT